MPHHAIAKWQRNAHNTNLRVFKPGELLIESDFIEKHKCEASSSQTCGTAPTATMMVALVHHSPDEFKRHKTEAWIFVSDDKNHDFDFHAHALRVIIEYYTVGKGSAATKPGGEAVGVPRVYIWTDGCAKQYKGKRNFWLIANSLEALGVIIEHNFAATSHFKGTHDGLGGVAKNMLRRAETNTDAPRRIHNAKAAYTFLEEHMGRRTVEESEAFFASWSPYKVRQTHVMWIPYGTIARPVNEFQTLHGTRSLYQFVGDMESDDCTKTTKEVQTNDNSTGVIGAVESEGGREKEIAVSEVPYQEYPTTWKLEKRRKKLSPIAVRSASCFCSSCRDQTFSECLIQPGFPSFISECQVRNVTEVVTRTCSSTEMDEDDWEEAGAASRGEHEGGYTNKWLGRKIIL